VDGCKKNEVCRVDNKHEKGFRQIEVMCNNRKDAFAQKRIVVFGEP